MYFVGSGLIIKVMVFGQELLFVKVILHVPSATPVTKPDALTVANNILEQTQGVELAAVPVPNNCKVDPAQTYAVSILAPPLVKLTEGEILTFIAKLSETHPLKFV